MKILLVSIVILSSIVRGEEKPVENFYRSKEYMLSYMKTGLRWDPFRFVEEEQKYFLTVEFFNSAKPSLKNKVFAVNKMIVEDANNHHEGFSFFLPENQNIKSMIIEIRIPKGGIVQQNIRIFNIENLKIKFISETGDPSSRYHLKD